MKETTIDCSLVRSREDLHRLFQESLCFPEWYGSNLDALYDCLTEISGKVRILNWEIVEEHLGAYGIKAKKAIAAAALRNTTLNLYI